MKYLKEGINGEGLFGLQSDASNRLYWYISSSGNLQARKTVAGADASVFSTAYVAATHQWLRILHDGANIDWDTSTDGATWTNRGTFATPITITALSVRLYAETYEAIASPGTCIFDTINVARLPIIRAHVRQQQIA